MATNVKPTKKNSPAIRPAVAPYNRPASEYAEPHTMENKPVTAASIDSQSGMDNPIGLKVKMPMRDNWTPMNGGVSIGHNGEVKTEGIRLRGTGAAERGVVSRGPMA